MIKWKTYTTRHQEHDLITVRMGRNKTAVITRKRIKTILHNIETNRVSGLISDEDAQVMQQRYQDALNKWEESQMPTYPESILYS